MSKCENRKRLQKNGLKMRKHLEKTLSRVLTLSATLFDCSFCKNTLQYPITVECGHTFCSKCLYFINFCVVCQKEISGKCRINVLLQKLLDKWKKIDVQSLEDHIFSTTGVKPRYYLRKGYSGLLFKNENQKGDKQTSDSALSALNIMDLTSDCWDHNHIAKFESCVLQNIQELLSSSLNETEYDLDCVLCGESMLEPVTTSCGHSFCKECLIRVLDHQPVCPLCKKLLDLTEYHKNTSLVLDDAIKFLQPIERDKRIVSRTEELKILENNEEIPVFICITAFPGVACPLYVYEPQYRLLTRRCLLTKSKQFAMVGRHSDSHEKLTCGTILEIKDAVTLEDGRFILSTIGIRRFQIIDTVQKDGYDSAKIEYITDDPIPPQYYRIMIALHMKIYNKACRWIESLNSKVLVAEVERFIGQMPAIEPNWLLLPDGPSWTWWLMPLLPLSTQLQVGLLRTTRLEKRLLAIDKMLDHLKFRSQSMTKNNVINDKTGLSEDVCEENYSQQPQ